MHGLRGTDKRHNTRFHARSDELLLSVFKENQSEEKRSSKGPKASGPSDAIEIPFQFSGGANVRDVTTSVGLRDRQRVNLLACSATLSREQEREFDLESHRAHTCPANAASHELPRACACGAL